MSNKRSLIIFDIDGTLTQSVEVHQKIFKEMLTEIGVEEDYSALNSFKHHTDSFIAKEIFEIDRNQQFSDAKRVEFEEGLTRKINLETFQEIKGAKVAIDKLEKSTDFCVCYATGSLLRPAKHKLNSIGINYIDSLLVASDTLFSRKDIVAKAISRAKEYYAVREFERIISVGDGLWDLITAKTLGLDFIGVGLKNKKVLEENGANIVLNDLTELEKEITSVKHCI